jgi:preprotein translocase subunit SecG
MRIALIIGLLIISIILIVSVLMQPSKTNGLSGFMGGGSDTYFSKNKTKTQESMLARVTIVTSVLFAGLVIALNLIK